MLKKRGNLALAANFVTATSVFLTDKQELI